MRKYVCLLVALFGVVACDHAELVTGSDPQPVPIVDKAMGRYHFSLRPTKIILAPISGVEELERANVLFTHRKTQPPEDRSDLTAPISPKMEFRRMPSGDDEGVFFYTYKGVNYPLRKEQIEVEEETEKFCHPRWHREEGGELIYISYYCKWPQEEPQQQQ